MRVYSMSEDKYKQFLAIINGLEDKVNNLNAKVKVYEDFIGKHKNVEEDINAIMIENEKLKQLVREYELGYRFSVKKS